MNIKTSALALGLLSCWANVAYARPIKPAGVTASSEYPEENGVKYEAKNIADGKASTAWYEGDQGGGLGSSVTIDLGGDKSINALRIWNGNWFTTDYWNRNNRLKEIDVEFSDGSKQSFTLKDEMVAEVITFPKAVVTSSVKIKIKSIYKGTTFSDSCVSEVQVLDNQPDDFITPAHMSASSTYPADGDGDYDAANMNDMLLDSMWCEASKDGDGTGEWVEFDLGGNRNVSKLRFNNGNATSLGDNMKANRATAATLTFSDGSTQAIAIKPTPATQVIEFSSKNTSKVRITFSTVVRGKEFNDLCVSEAAFQE